MYTISINGKTSIKTDLSVKGNKISGTLGQKSVEGDIEAFGAKEFHLLLNNQSYNIQLIKADFSEKKLLVKINGQKYNIDVKDKYDELLHNLGLDSIASKKVNDVKAPMPGMVLNILVSEGQQVKKGDSLLILEAMKMENILKSPSDGIIKKVVATKG
ncbi:MAG: biotin/lipoyl-containing protein, partial [Bacteroidia bacterium]